ncbi:pilus assembly protein TadG-related protein [Bradyrhizobium sp.]|uniref:pilus assembly protein TadG-related protein n=1 Tax=Bradyrhizobium sp. TaxID=376 RepID=UPI003C5755B4
MSEPRVSSRLIALILRFRRDTRANLAVIFALALLPVLAAIGSATDYTMATRMKAKMQSAADAASVASISEKSAGYLAATLMTSNGPVPAGVTDATNIFNGNLAIAGYTNLAVTSTVTKTGPTLTSTVQFSAQVPAVFMKVLGYQTLSISGTSKSTSSLPLYLDFYLTLDVSGSMGLPSTPTEAGRMEAISPDNWVQYRSGCTLACHFAPQKSACVDPPVTPPAAPPANPSTTTTSYTQQYNTNNYCMGYVYSRLGQTALTNLINSASTKSVPKQVPGLPDAMLSGLNTTVTAGSPNSLIAGNSSSLPYSIPAVSSCPTAGTDNCIQLRLDAVGNAVNALFQTANSPAYETIPNQFRIGLYPFIQYLDSSYSPLTSSINGDPETSGTINYAAANLATLLDTNTNSTLGSGGTHIDTALDSINTLIKSVGDGSTSSDTLPYVFLITDGAQDNQTKIVPNGSWSGSNHATVIDPIGTTVCSQLKNRGIIVSVLYIPYQPINPTNSSFAGDEDDAANNNIPNIPPSLQGCASPGYFYTANSPADITAALQAMFQHALTTAHIIN